MKERMAGLDGTSHAFDHVERVYDTAMLLAREESADMELVQVGALLHDVGRVIGDPHAEHGVTVAEEILENLEYPIDKRSKILQIIAEHHLTGNTETLEEQIIWDADKLDLIGVVGMARVFHWSGERQRSFASAIRFCIERLQAIYPPIANRDGETDW